MDSNQRREIQNMRERSGRMTRDYTDHLESISPGVYLLFRSFLALAFFIGDYFSDDFRKQHTFRTKRNPRTGRCQLYAGRCGSFYESFEILRNVGYNVFINTMIIRGGFL